MSFDYAPAKYAQVVAEIQRRIECGEYAPGSLLPSEHQLVNDSGCPGRRSSRRCRRCGKTAGSRPSRARAVSCGGVRRWPGRSAPAG